MPHLGLICPELSGHLNPMTTLGRELQRRGHRVTIIARPDARIKVESRGLEFSSVGDKTFPPAQWRGRLRSLVNWAGSVRFDLRPSCCAARRPITLEEAPEAIRVAGIEGLLVD
jgi:UDP:flavonoid glycosyltransferase YjiC (YdhE family)